LNLTDNLDIEINEDLRSNLFFDINYFGAEKRKIKYFIDTSNEKEIKNIVTL
jgi:hypothetical protein